MWKRVINFIKRNNYNPLIISFKFARFFIIKSLYAITGVGVYLILTVIWPFEKIKFCFIRADRIGHLAANTEIFIRRLRAGYYDHECLYIGCSGKPCNRQLLTMFKRTFPIVENEFLSKTVNTPIFKRSKFYKELPYNSNEYYEFNNLPSTLSFTHEEEEKGMQELEKMGIDPNGWFVCFHARDSAYLNETQEGRDWTYHDYRNCKINNYLKAMEYIVEHGGYAIRMGAVVENPLPELNNHKIIDYATKYRSDFMDVYLSVKCKFFVGCTAGLHMVPAIFGVPVVGTNFTHLELPPYRRGDLFLPKKIRDVKEDRLLTFSEIFARRIGSWTNGQNFTEAGLEAIENTPDEILELVQEMNESLDETFRHTEEDEELQMRFRSLIQPHHYCYGAPVRIGAKFLRQNKEMLI